MYCFFIWFVLLFEIILYFFGGKGVVSLLIDCCFDLGMYLLVVVGFECVIFFVGELRDCGFGEFGGGVFFLFGGFWFWELEDGGLCECVYCGRGRLISM